MLKDKFQKCLLVAGVVFLGAVFGVVTLDRDMIEESSLLEHEPWDSSAVELLSHNNSMPHCAHSFSCVDKYVCRHGRCQGCQHTAECQVVNVKNVCRREGTALGTCVHKTLFGHFDQSDLFIAIITFVTTALSAPAGTGGGGVLVPMYIIVGHFSPHGAIPLSKATIFGGAVANNFFNLQRRHPRADRPLVDFRSVLLLEPILLLGTVLGVFFNALSPGWLITSLLVFTLSFVTYRTALKGISAYKTEMGEARLVVPESSIHKASEIGPGERQALIHSELRSSASHDGVGDHSGGASELAGMVEYERRAFWYQEVGVLIVAWIIIGICAYLKGGDGAPGVATCGTALYWFFVCLPIPLIGVITWKVSAYLINDHSKKEELNYRFVEGDLKWTKDNVIKYPAYCFFAGFAAGALGIAAGTVLGPVMLELGMLPIVATASSGFMVLFTASSTTTQFLIMGQLQIDYAMFFSFVGIFGAALGNTGVNWLVKKYHKTYFIIFILAFVIGGSVILMGITGVLREIDAVKHGKTLWFRPLCA